VAQELTPVVVASRELPPAVTLITIPRDNSSCRWLSKRGLERGEQGERIGSSTRGQQRRLSAFREFLFFFQFILLSCDDSNNSSSFTWFDFIMFFFWHH